MGTRVERQTKSFLDTSEAAGVALEPSAPPAMLAVGDSAQKHKAAIKDCRATGGCRPEADTARS
jgi:hypothetical protein